MEAPTALSNVQALKPNMVRRPTADEVSAETVAAAGSSGSVDQVHTVRVVLPSLAAEAFASSGKDGEERKDDVAHAVHNFNEFFQMVRRTVQFSLDEDSGRTIVQVKDAETHELIRQIPSEEILRLAKQLDEFKDGFKGMLLKEKV
ncbi:flagellar protein FlaG [Methylocaldum sp.]|uniref:flagellar protein FlaG n=1 Tax=Methylocaldum sp. TaxID=1969727 RepID=UPI002D3A6A9F|nr:flagellar protein FlaG [Methylocaldum sp.]HYE35214.1 flagellar protein FlaG [Methylocaldum sp.]